MKTDKELYPIFQVDTCIQSYSIEYTLIGAKDVEDLIQHLPDILKEMDKPYKDARMLMKSYKTWPPEIIEGAYTDRPYEPLSTFAYYE